MYPAVRTFLPIMLLLAAVAVNNAQTFEVPNIEYPNDLCELRDENRVFVHAPLNTRQKIVKELRERSSLLIVERPEEADFLLLFTYAPFVDGSSDGTPSDANGVRAELAVVKFVTDPEGKARPRILFYWSAQKSSRSIPVPFTGISPSGFATSRSGKGAAAELIMRLALWAAHKKFPTRFYFDQFTNQLTIRMGGTLEVKGIKAFLQSLKNARSDAYARRCLGPPKLHIPRYIISPQPSPSRVTRGTRVRRQIRRASRAHRIRASKAITPVMRRGHVPSTLPRKRRRTANKEDI